MLAILTIIIRISMTSILTQITATTTFIINRTLPAIATTILTITSQMEETHNNSLLIVVIRTLLMETIMEGMIKGMIIMGTEILTKTVLTILMEMVLAMVTTVTTNSSEIKTNSTITTMNVTKETSEGTTETEITTMDSPIQIAIRIISKVENVAIQTTDITSLRITGESNFSQTTNETVYVSLFL